MHYVTVTPAYGRDYKSKREAKEAWLEGKDFQVQPSGQYCSKDSPFPKGTIIMCQYRKLTQIQEIARFQNRILGLANEECIGPPIGPMHFSFSGPGRKRVRKTP